MVALKTHLRVEADAEALRKQRDEDAMLKVIEEEAGGRFATSCRFAPSLRRRGPEVIPERDKHGKLRVCSWSPCNVPHRVAQALSLNAGRYHGHLLQSLSNTWARWCETVDFAPIDYFKHTDAKPKASVCFDAGMCICDVQGKVMQTFKASLENVLNKLCPEKSPNRAKLVNADLVLVLFGQEKPHDDIEHDVLFHDVILQSVPFNAIKWLHIGHHALSPWRASYHEMLGLR